MATLKQRKEFWETLKSFDGKNIAEEVKTISANGIAGRGIR